MRKQLVPVLCATGLILAGLVGCKKENLLNPNGGGVSSQMVTPNLGGKFLKSGGGGYVDLVDEFYPDIERNEDLPVIQNFSNELNRLQNDSANQVFLDKSLEESKWLLEVFLNYHLAHTENPIDSSIQDTLLFDVDIADNIVKGVGLAETYLSTYETLSQYDGYIDFVDVFVTSIQESYIRFGLIVSHGNSLGDGWCDEPKPITKGYNAIVLAEAISTSINCISELAQYNKVVHYAANIYLLPPHIFTMHCSDPNYMGGGGCLGPAGFLWTGLFPKNYIKKEDCQLYVNRALLNLQHAKTKYGGSGSFYRSITTYNDNGSGGWYPTGCNNKYCFQYSHSQEFYVIKLNRTPYPNVLL